MRTKEIFNRLIYSVLFLTLISCSENNQDKRENVDPTEVRKQYDASKKALNLIGVYFSTPKANTNTLILNFDKINKKIKNTENLGERTSLMQSTVGAMEDFVRKSDALLQVSDLNLKERSIVSTKRDMVNRRLSQATALLEKYNHEKNSKEILAEAVKRNESEKPFFVSINEQGIHLCGSSLDSKEQLEREYNEYSGRQATRIEVSKSLICADQGTIEQVSQSFSDFRNARRPYRTGLHIISDTRQDKLLNLDDLSSLHNQTLTTSDRHMDWTRPEVLLNLSVFEIASIVETEGLVTSDFISFLKNEIVSDDESRDLFLWLYPSKEEILGKFKNNKITKLFDDQFELANMKTTDEIINYIVKKNYSSLGQYASSKNSNKVSYNSELMINKELTAYGLSPLMVAALLDDVQSIEILLAIDGVDPNFESPLFKRGYLTIGEVSRSTIKSFQSSSFFGGSGLGGGGSSSSGYNSNKLRGKYRGYTSLMIAVAEANCDAVDAIIEIEPETINYRTSRGSTALKVSVAGNRNYCLKALLKAGAFDIYIFDRYDSLLHYDISSPDYREGISDKVVASDFTRNVSSKLWEDTSVRKYVAKTLLFTRLHKDLKRALLEKVPLTIDDARKMLRKEEIEIENYYSRNMFSANKYARVKFKRDTIDLEILSSIGFDFSKERVFGETSSGETVFSYVFKRINSIQAEKLIEAHLKSFFSQFYAINPKWVTDWINSMDSFENQNPLVAASMYNEVSMVKALLSFDGVKVNAIDMKTGYNAYEWNYSIKPVSNIFSVFGVADLLQEKGARVRPIKANFTGKPNAKSKNDMMKKIGEQEYPFTSKSPTTIDFINP